MAKSRSIIHVMVTQRGFHVKVNNSVDEFGRKSTHVVQHSVRLGNGTVKDMPVLRNMDDASGLRYLKYLSTLPNVVHASVSPEAF